MAREAAAEPPAVRGGSVAAGVRSWLFVPADDDAKLQKALRAGAGAVIVDLEDAVGPDRKAQARENAARFLTERTDRRSAHFMAERTDRRSARFMAERTDRRGGPLCVLRINDPTLDRGRADLDLLAERGPVAMVPKARLDTIEHVAGRAAGVIPLVETAQGVLELERIAQVPGVVAVALGTVDLAADLGLRPLPDGAELLHVRSRLVVACAAAGVPAIDGAALDLSDQPGLRRAAERARALGFAGKLCIHPRQIAPVEGAFRPTASEVERARRMVQAYEQALRSGNGAAAFEGEMIDLATVRLARLILDEAGDPPPSPGDLGGAAGDPPAPGNLGGAAGDPPPAPGELGRSL